MKRQPPRRRSEVLSESGRRRESPGFSRGEDVKASTLETAERLLGAFPMGVSCIGCERLDLDRRTAFRPGMAA